MKHVENVCLNEISDKFKVGNVESKTRPLGQILEKPYVCSRGHIFSLIIRKPGQNICLDLISNEFENGLCWLKSWVTRSNLIKNLIYALAATFSV